MRLSGGAIQADTQRCNALILETRNHLSRESRRDARRNTDRHVELARKSNELESVVPLQGIAAGEHQHAAELGYLTDELFAFFRAELSWIRLEHGVGSAMFACKITS